MYFKQVNHTRLGNFVETIFIINVQFPQNLNDGDDKFPKQFLDHNNFNFGR